MTKVTINPSQEQKGEAIALYQNKDRSQSMVLLELLVALCNVLFSRSLSLIDRYFLYVSISTELEKDFGTSSRTKASKNARCS